MIHKRDEKRCYFHFVVLKERLYILQTEHILKAHFMMVTGKAKAVEELRKSPNEKPVNSVLFIGSEHIWFHMHIRCTFHRLTTKLPYMLEC